MCISHPGSTLGFEFGSQVGVISAKRVPIDITVLNGILLKRSAQFVCFEALFTYNACIIPFHNALFSDTNKINELYETSCDIAFQV